MSDFTQFEAVEPVVIPAIPATVYDKYWLEVLVIRAPSPAQDANLTARFRLYNDTTREFAPDTEAVSVSVENLFANAANSELMAGAMEGVFQALKVELDKVLNPPTTTTTTTEAPTEPLEPIG